MALTRQQLQSFDEQGFLLLPEVFSPQEIALLKEQLPSLFAEDSPRRVLEKDGRTVRSVYGSHQTNEVFRRLCQDARLVEPAMELLGGPVYLHQLKLNAKLGMVGDVWEWHQDLIFWVREDGMQRPLALSAALFMDDVTEFNGPLLFIPGSHREGIIDVPARQEVPPEYRGSPGWISNLTAALKFSLDKDTVARLVQQNGLTAPKGPSGSLLLFHCNMCHASGPNLSPFNRMLTLATYNSVDNIPVPVANPRPDFLCGRDFTPIQPVVGPLVSAQPGAC